MGLINGTFVMSTDQGDIIQTSCSV